MSTGNITMNNLGEPVPVIAEIKIEELVDQITFKVGSMIKVNSKKMYFI